MNNRKTYFYQNHHKILTHILTVVILMYNKKMIIQKLNKLIKMQHHNYLKYKKDAIAKDQGVYNYIVNVLLTKDIVAKTANVQTVKIIQKILISDNKLQLRLLKEIKMLLIKNLERKQFLKKDVIVKKLNVKKKNVNVLIMELVVINTVNAKIV